MIRIDVFELKRNSIRVHGGLFVHYACSDGEKLREQKNRTVRLLLMPDVAVGAEHRARKSPSNAITVINMKRDLAA